MASRSQPDDGEQVSGDDYPGIKGVRFVFSGGNISGRWSYWEKLIERNGGTVSDSVSEETDYLVIDGGVDLGERQSASKYGVPTIEDSEFEELLNGLTPASEIPYS
jgi:NAD-dependent DNA ligase